MLHDNLTVNNQGHLEMGGIDTTLLAAHYGTPLYVLDEDKIRSNCRRFVSAMHEHFGPGSAPIHSSKALSFKALYPILHKEGLHADVSSVGEIYTAVTAGFPPENLYYLGDTKMREDIEFAIENHVGFFIVDNLSELDTIDEVAGRNRITQKVLLRVPVKLNISEVDAIAHGNYDSQFGLPTSALQAEDLVASALDKNNIDVVGYHCHIGNDFLEGDPYLDQISNLMDFATDMLDKYGFTASVINLGGGFSVRYTKMDPIIDIEGRIARIADLLRTKCAENGFPFPAVQLNAGRSIVGDAGLTLYTVNQTKVISGYRSFVTIDGGIADNPRYAMYKAPYTILVANRMNEAADFTCSIAGRSCESRDLIQEAVRIPKPKYGDILACLSTGAYNYAKASNYNRLAKPPIVMLRGGTDRLVVRRETLDDVVRCDL